jgi:uncharacterized protein YhbP (UPF0306 family)
VNAEPSGGDVPGHVLDYIDGHRTLTLATASQGGVPNASTLLYVNEGPKLYFWTKPSTTTARHIEANPHVSFTIDDDPEDLNQARGVQGRGEASVVLSGEEVARAAALFGDRFPDLSPGNTLSISFFRIVPTDLQFIDNTSAGTVAPDAGFGAEFHQERAYSIFTDLPVRRVDSIAAPMETVTAAEGEVIVRQGGPADKFFIVVEGEVQVVRDDSEVIATLGPGHFFGEMAIMLDRPRVATVRATQATRLLALERDTFRTVVAESLGTTGEFDTVIQQRLAALASEG